MHTSHTLCTHPRLSVPCPTASAYPPRPRFHALAALLCSLVVPSPSPWSAPVTAPHAHFARYSRSPHLREKTRTCTPVAPARNCLANATPRYPPWPRHLRFPCRNPRSPRNLRYPARARLAGAVSKRYVRAEPRGTGHGACQLDRPEGGRGCIRGVAGVRGVAQRRRPLRPHNHPWPGPRAHRP